MQYWPIDPDTHEVLAPQEALVRGGILHASKFSLLEMTLETRDGYAIIATLDEEGLPSGTAYAEDYRGQQIYLHSNGQETLTVTQLGPVPDGWTLTEPATRFDYWTESGWQTDKQAQFEAEVKAVNNIRRQEYARISDPLLSESLMLRELGDDIAAEATRQQALEWYQKIKDDNPWPQPPV